MSESIFENMGIDISKIYSICVEKKSERLKLKNGSTGKTIIFENKISMFVLSDCGFEPFIQTFAHEVGHATQVCGIFEDEKRFITRVIAESIAFKFEKEFLIKFNNKYNTTISVNAVFNGFGRYGFAYYIKNVMILITKSEYKLNKALGGLRAPIGF